jgi:transposase
MQNESPVRSSSFHLPVIAHIEHGYSLREIATRFGCSVTTVHRRVHACGDGGRSSSAPAAGGTKKT